MNRRTRCILAVLALGAPLLASPPVQAQSVRSVVVEADASGRLLPAGSSSTDLPSPDARRYWADTPTHSIRRSHLDGTGVEVVAGGLNVPYGLSFDAATGSLLWTSSGDEVVQRLAAGSGPEVLPSSFEEPFAIVLEQKGLKVAYALLDGEIVRVTRADDSETETVETLTRFGSLFAGLHGLALDEAAGVLYLGDLNGMMTQRLHLADGRVESLAYVDEAFPGEPVLQEDPQ